MCILVWRKPQSSSTDLMRHGSAPQQERGRGRSEGFRFRCHQMLQRRLHNSINTIKNLAFGQLFSNGNASHVISQLISEKCSTGLYPIPLKLFFLSKLSRNLNEFRGKIFLFKQPPTMWEKHIHQFTQFEIRQIRSGLVWNSRLQSNNISFKIPKFPIFWDAFFIFGTTSKRRTRLQPSLAERFFLVNYRIAPLKWNLAGIFTIKSTKPCFFPPPSFSSGLLIAWRGC